MACSPVREFGCKQTRRKELSFCSVKQPQSGGARQEAAPSPAPSPEPPQPGSSSQPRAAQPEPRPLLPPHGQRSQAQLGLGRCRASERSHGEKSYLRTEGIIAALWCPYIERLLLGLKQTHAAAPHLLAGGARLPHSGNPHLHSQHSGTRSRSPILGH